jgi:putative flippase GtrA
MSVADAVAHRASARFGVPESEAKRLLGYAAVGATGVVVDLSVVQAARMAGLHWLLAVGLAFWTAMTWNFTLQRTYVWRASGSVVRQYVRYVFVDVGALGVRVAVVAATVSWLHPWEALPYVPGVIAPAVPGSLLGICCAVVVGFVGTEILVFGGEQR